MAKVCQKERHLTTRTPMKKVLILLLLIAVNTSYFYYNRFEQVHIQPDDYGITHYRAGVYDTYQEAKTTEKIAKKNGYENTQIIQSTPVSLTKNATGRNQLNFKESRLFLKTFRCENESVHINKEDRQHLEEIVQLMKEDPSLKLRVLQSPKTFTPIHQGRLKTISNFLMAKGIAPYRMRITNAHHDFLTAIEEATASSSAPYLEDASLIITLINLKEEIIVNPTPPSHFGGRISDVGITPPRNLMP